MNNENTILDPQQTANAEHHGANANSNHQIEQAMNEDMKNKAHWGERAAFAAGGVVLGAGSSMAGQAMAAEPSEKPEVEADDTGKEEAEGVEAADSVQTANAATSTDATQQATSVVGAPHPADSPAPEDTIVATATGVRVAQVDDDMSFAEAFADARAQVGPGGVFEWHGRAYGTYYKDEWSAMSPAERHEFQSSINYSDVISDESMARHYNETAQNQPVHQHQRHSASHQEEQHQVQHQQHQQHQGKESEQPGNGGQAAEDVEVSVLEVGQIDLNEDGVPENAAILEVDGHHVMVVDINRDGVADVAVADVDNDEKPDVVDVSDAHLQMPTASAGDAYMAQAETAPDYTNDANVGLYEV